ncbi:hypothetical protein NP493_86g03015 [Ridgeia piscesae]|uniref:G-protein coupled receptors family 1 profile domain-containing protein n=1 Tax=Ridgeia piscesae TaxID=27915 RepID=A0AAD9P8Q0_RIDPI|nr:hypothetical protein NP493_86g03015 [Ridgeia piscesae]
MLLSVTFAFIILTGPIAVTLILEKSWVPPKEAHGSAIWRLWRTVVSNLMYTNHAINFLLYSVSGRKFRREFCRIVPCIKCCGGAGGESDTSRNVAIMVTPASDHERSTSIISAVTEDTHV